MDIVSDTAVWFLVRAFHLVLALGRSGSRALLSLLDWGSQKTVNGLRLVARWTQWALDNPKTAAIYLAVTVVLIFLVLAIEIYVYDLIKRRKAPAPGPE